MIHHTFMTHVLPSDSYVILRASMCDFRHTKGSEDASSANEVNGAPTSQPYHAVSQSDARQYPAILSDITNHVISRITLSAARKLSRNRKTASMGVAWMLVELNCHCLPHPFFPSAAIYSTAAFPY